MPVTIQTAGLKYKNGQGQFQSADCIKGDSGDISIIAVDYSNLTFPVTKDTLCTHDFKLYKAKADISSLEVWNSAHWDEVTVAEELSGLGTCDVSDVQVNGTSVVNNGVANIPVAGDTYGVVRVSGYGLQMQNGTVATKTSTAQEIQMGQRTWEHISPANQHYSTFYGLAKSAGDNTQASSANQIGIYTDSAKSAIQTMLDVPSNDDLKTVVESKASAIINTASGAVASFEDGADEMPVESLVVNIDPVQDLHGQDAPYPPGGGKNLIDANVNTYASAESVSLKQGTYTISAKSSLSNGFWYISGQKQDTSYCSKSELGISAWNDSSASTGVYYGNPQTSQYFTFTVPEDNVSIKIGRQNADGTIPEQIESGSSATTFAPYSNICPISGWTGCNVSRTGKNLLKWENASTTINGVTFTANADGSVTANGTADGGDASFYSANPADVPLIAGNYILSGCPSGGSNTTFMLNETIKSARDDGSGANLNLTADGNIRVRIVIRNGYNAQNLVFKPMIRLSSETDTTFKPYAGQTYPISWQTEAGTVYGGTLDVATGVLTVDKASVDLGTLGYTYDSTNNQFQTGALMKSGISGASAGIKCSQYESGNYAYNATYNDKDKFIYPHTSGSLRVRDSSYTDPNVFRTAMSGVQLVYPLITEIVYQLTPVEVVTLLGINNIYADCGEVSVNYSADTKRYVDQNEGVKDVQVNGTSVLSQGVANIPIASINTFGVIKCGIDSGGVGLSNETNAPYIVKAVQSEIKMGYSQYKPIVPSVQHISTFYGLAAAAGDSTQSASDNAVGTYTDGAKVAINNMLGSVSKDSLDNAGITARTYTTKFGGEFSVTTVASQDYISPYARASVTGRISKHNLHSVMFNGTEYILRTRLWFEKLSGETLKVYEYLGNLGLYVSDVTGVPGGIDNVPFCIISDLNNSSSIDVFTQTAGTYTILVKQINNTQVSLPKSLVWDDSYAPFEKKNNGGGYNGYSIGVNDLHSSRATFAIGYGNKITNEFTFAVGAENIITQGYVFGQDNNVNTGYAFGRKNSTAGGYAIGSWNDTKMGAFALGDNLLANKYTTVLGRYNVAIPDIVLNDWEANTEYVVGDIVIAHPAQGINQPVECKEAHTSGSTFMNDYIAGKWKMVMDVYTDTSFVFGNGTGENDRKNVLKIKKDGTSYFAGDIYVNCNADSTGGTMLPKDVQVDGVSVVANGIAEIPKMGTNVFGVAAVNGGQYGIGTTVSRYLYTVEADNTLIKAGTNSFRAITPNHQHESVFYGLSKLAGVDLTSEAVTVGTYPQASKIAIQNMLGVETGVAFVETVSGTTPSITGIANTRYLCGEVSTLSITPPASGTIIVRFTSGSTATVLTLPSTVKFPEWIDLTTLDANTVYEIMIEDGVYGGVMTWQG